MERIRSSRMTKPAVIGGAALIGALAFALGRAVADAPGEVISAVHRLTEFVGLEEFPAMSPDSKAVAFTARVGGVEQVFVRLVAGGTPLQVTKDKDDHALPRWSPDSSSIVAPAAIARLSSAGVFPGPAKLTRSAGIGVSSATMSSPAEATSNESTSPLRCWTTAGIGFALIE